MRADAAINKRQLLDSAAQLLAEQGPQVSLRTIAKQAGVGVATLYRHFPTRVLEQRARTLEEVEAALAHAHDAGLVRDDVLAVRFIMGIAVVARPLPSRAAEMVPDQAEWLMTTYLSGLAPR